LGLRQIVPAALDSEKLNALLSRMESDGCSQIAVFVAA
jgi:hypothetical protein